VRGLTVSPPPRLLRAGARAAGVTLTIAALALTVCSLDPISDPPVDLEVQPLEVVVDSRSRPHTPCLLNVEKVRAGDHAVTVIGDSGYAQVRILDESGRLVFRTDNTGQRIETDEDGGVTIVGGEGHGPQAHLEPGTFSVTCRPKDGKPGETTLVVLPASPDQHRSS